MMTNEQIYREALEKIANGKSHNGHARRICQDALKAAESAAEPTAPTMQCEFCHRRLDPTWRHCDGCGVKL